MIHEKGPDESVKKVLFIGTRNGVSMDTYRMY
jgi:hypothetical protein